MRRLVYVSTPKPRGLRACMVGLEVNWSLSGLTYKFLGQGRGELASFQGEASPL